MMPDPVSDASKFTVQQLPDAEAGARLRLFGRSGRGPLLPPWGSHERERALRQIYRSDFNWLVRGAFAGIMSVVATTPWEIRGPQRLGAPEARLYTRLLWQEFRRDPLNPRADLDYWQAVLRHANFGRGWDAFIKTGVDFLRHDSGWFVEVIAPGDPNEPPTGAVVGLATLDALRCFPTGDPEYPVHYVDLDGRWHRLHRTRVLQLQDMPDRDEAYPGYGHCALSRAIAIAHNVMLMEQYNAAKLDDQPPPGIVVASNISKQERDAAYRAMVAEQQLDAPPQWGRTLWFYGLDAQTPAKIETLTFQQAPDGWDYPSWVEVSVKELALALGVDIQELWELSGGSIGTATQSAILHAKSRGKTIGNLRTAIERALNDILPEPYEFRFTFTDYEQDQQRAAAASTWVTIAAQTAMILGERTAAKLLLNTVQEVRDAHAEAQDGSHGVADDVDVGAEPEVPLPSDAAPAAEPARGNGRLAADVGGRDDADLVLGAASKAIQATRLDFEDTAAPLFRAAQRGELSPVRLGIILRAELRRYGMKAMLDGLRDGGLEVDKLEDEDDLETFRNWLREQSGYVSELTRSIATSPIDPADRATMWSNKSLLAAYRLGVASADRNGLYEWVLGNTREHCRDCLRYNGQRHRMKDWVRRNALPQTGDLECGGFFCQCRLVKVAGRARGRF